MRRKIPGVRASLAVLVVGCVLPLASVAAFLIVDFYEREQAVLMENTVSRARAIMAVVDHGFESTASALQALATSHQLHDGDLKGFHERAVDVLDMIHADSIVLVDPSGALLLSTRRPYGTPLPRLRATPLLRRILQTGKPGVSDMFMGPIANQYVYTVGVPVRRDGAIVMSLNATWTPIRLHGVLAQQKLANTWRAAIIDSTGHIAARTHDNTRFVGKEVVPALLQRLRTSAEGVLEANTLDGIPVLTAYSRSSASGWSVALGIPVDELTRGFHRSLVWLIAGTVAALALGLVLAWRIGGGIARSMHALVEPARKVAGGGMAPLPQLEVREANEVALALHDAAAVVSDAQAGMRESEQRLALAVNAARMGIWVRDLVHGGIWVSDVWRELMGFTAEQEVTMSVFLERVHADDRAALMRTLYEAQEAGGGYQTEFRVQLPDGTQRWVGSHGSIECGSDGRARLARGVSFDITQRKQAELEAQHKQKEVMHLSRVAMLGELSGALAHELNQPLTAILSNAQAAQRFMRLPQPDLDEVRDILQDIIDEDQRAGEIILRLRRLFSNADMPRQAVELNELVSGVTVLLRNDLINHGVKLIVEPAPAGMAVSADPVQLQQVLVNLLMNACDAMADTQGERTVTVRAGLAEEGRADIAVSDCGSGVPQAMLERIFESFYTTKARGMGLGLSICRTIVKAHGGELRAENNPGQGATFHLVLPLQETQQP
ncbi:PAS domain-containing protein [Duganella sp. FT92W]|uniref:histidine kinase n=1 Tax=Pseudoduganella rivuli TaxID=2666085 RepID=A0A7X2LV38_9BURK|nr:ATP-binding protein [Pseudoduganella rivuli]MRV73529.1 PAS domain-containing protein [Pseudoduganella rivuli]